jgi:NAD-reducing hydrogenase small subunit
MSLLDIDERLLELVHLAVFDRMPLTDVKRIGECDLGIIEGGVGNAENVEVLQDFRRHCRILVAIGACAINGGIPAMRNQFDLGECLAESYVRGAGLHNPMVPNDPEIPLLLDRIYPAHEVVRIDYFLPGCPPSADAIWTFLTELMSGRPIAFPHSRIHYD